MISQISRTSSSCFAIALPAGGGNVSRSAPTRRERADKNRPVFLVTNEPPPAKPAANDISPTLVNAYRGLWHLGQQDGNARRLSHKKAGRALRARLGGTCNVGEMLADLAELRLTEFQLSGPDEEVDIRLSWTPEEVDTFHLQALAA